MASMENEDNSTFAPYDYCSDFWQLGATDVSDDLELIRYIHLVFLVPPIVAMGIVGNICALIVLNEKRFSSRAYRYLFWLAIADLCTLSTSVIYQLTTIETLYRHFGYGSAFLSCHVIMPVMNAFGGASAFMIVALTADRLIAVYRPLAFHTQQGMLRAGSAAVIAFSLAFMLYSPNPFQHSLMAVGIKGTLDALEKRPICYRCTWSFFHRQTSVERYVFFREILTRLVPVVIVFLLNLSFIVVYLRRKTRRLSRGHASDIQAKERCRLIRMVLLMTTVFVVCMTPMALSVVALSTVRKRTTDIGFELFRSSARVLTYVNYSFNFYLYLFCSPTIRASFRDICKKAFTKLLTKVGVEHHSAMAPPRSPSSGPTDITFVANPSKPISSTADRCPEGD